MAKEIEEYFVKRLQTYLLEYLQDFSQNNMAKFSLGISSNIVLKNLQIKKQALLNFSFPMYIIDGKISQITINMPLNYKAQQPEMIVEGIDLQVCTIQEANLFVSNKDQQSQQGVENLKQHKLKIWEEQMAKYFEQLSPPNWIQKIVDGIYNNMSVQVKSFYLRFYNYSIFGCETQLKIRADIYIKATDKQFQQKFNGDVNTIYKLIEIKKLGIMYVKASKRKEEQQLLSPIDISIKLIINKNQDEQGKPFQNLTINIDTPVIFQLNKESKNYLLKLNEVLQNLEIVQDNFHFRPKCEVKNNYGEWWKYLINAVMQNQKNHKLDLGYSSRRLVLMKRYIELYKRKQTIILVPWLTCWTIQDETKFKKCEEQMSLKDLLKYREWAFQEIRIEAKRYYNSSKEGQNKQNAKPMLELWTNTINDQFVLKEQKKRDDDVPIELEDDEKINLYEILERDKTQVLSSYLKGQNNDPDQIKTQIYLSVHSIFLIILECRPANVAQYCPKNTKIFSFCQCKKCIQLIKKPQMDKQKTSSFNQNNSISEVVKQTQRQNDDGSFHTAKEIDSFYEEIEDLQKDDFQFSQDLSQDQRNNNSQLKQNFDFNRTNKLILIVSLIGIKVPVSIYQNGRLKTNENENSTIVIGEIKILASGMVPKLMEFQNKYNENTESQSPLFKKKDNPQKQKGDDNFDQKQFSYSRVRVSEFVNDVFEVSVTKDQSFFQGSDICFETFCEFLSQNQMNNVSCFLIDYENDKHGFQDFGTEQFKNYDKYFVVNDKEEKDEVDESMLLHVIKQQKNENKWAFLKQAALQIYDRSSQYENDNQWIGCLNKQKFLEEVHTKLIDIIKKSLFAPFLEEFGDKVIPLCIINLKDKLTFPADSKSYNLSISLYLEGDQSDYKISPQNEKRKKVSSQQTLDEQSNEQISIILQKFSIFISSKSLSSLLDFSQSMDKTSLSQGQLYVTQDHKLLECILKSKPLGQENTKPPGMKFSIQFVDKLKIRIVSDQISNIIKTELKFQIKNFRYSTVKIDDLFQNIVNKSGQTLLTIEQFKIAHKYFSQDYKNKNEELRNYEKEQQTDDKKSGLSSGKFPFSKQTSQQQSQSADQKSQQKGQKNQQQQPKSRDPMFHIKGIKQTILKTQIVALKFQANIENHALLTDSKLYVQIPFLNLRINDSCISFIELLLILKNNIKVKQTPQQKHKIGQDSLLKAELDTLFHDHKEQSSDCKHCILKYRKTVELTNILFGVISEITKSADVPCWFHILHNECQKLGNSSNLSVRHKKEQGIKITFQSTQKASNHGQYKSILAFPILVITRDIGYFKDNIMIHCSASKFKESGISTSKSRFDQENEINQFEKQNQKDISSQKGQSAQKKEANQASTQEKQMKETNYVLVQPALKVKEPLLFWQKLDDKFIFYCRSNEKDMFRLDYSKEYEDKSLEINSLIQDDDQMRLNDPNLYILLYYNKPLRTELIQNKENFQRNEKNSKKKIFFSLQMIKAIFQNQHAACNVLTTFQNINKIQSILKKVQDIVNYGYKLDENVEKQQLQDSPIKLLDEMIVSANISNIYLKSNESFFKLSQFKVILNLEYMSQISNNAKSSFHKKNSSSIVNQEVFSKVKSNITQVFPTDDLIIVKCHSIILNFNMVSIIDVKLIHVQKFSDALQLQVEEIKISITNNLSKQKENLLTMPKRDRLTQTKTGIQQETKKFEKPLAICIKLEFQNLNPKINISVHQGQIQLSQQRVSDLLIGLNSFYLLNIEESINLRQHLLKYIFLQELEIMGNDQPKDKLQRQQKLSFILELKIEEFQVVLQEKDKEFFFFEFHQISMKKKLIKNQKLKPQPSQGENVHYPNLIKQNGHQAMKILLENNIIHLENVQFFMISRFLNELDAFKSEVEKIIQKNKDELLEKYQSDFEFQMQLKQQENFELNKEQFNYQVLIKNSQIIVPQSSSDKNQVKILFDYADVKVKKEKKLSKIPEIQDDKIEVLQQQKLLVDYEDKYTKISEKQLEFQEIYITEIKANFRMVEVDYEMYCDQDDQNSIKGNLLDADSVEVEMNLPSFEQFLGISGWKYKDSCIIKPKNLKMKLDLGKLMKVQSYIDQNLSEKSSLFEFHKSSLQKINFDLDLFSTEASLTRYGQVEQDKLEKHKNAKLYETQKHRQSKQFNTHNQTKQMKKQNYDS
ncbi:unnamed protein product (macronuclear) [Paramecium tetraurelia]|uniref:Chorein N-terminal domain-containing protein n=1 Tax=Paramecium tetraurelia TaxID=5888 RepID=A0CWT7_PARTE|nr:uncharacterized protein GSPATT00001457001 [Paramecium tetraurelia]CAK75254.1 unnamed protein product [Paramecium tetraurelia]|eukprot:XP_001442651.1 hypothetical protein (macronuclear) [Paramecium tetraurelia strain d4-2]